MDEFTARQSQARQNLLLLTQDTLFSDPISQAFMMLRFEIIRQNACFNSPMLHHVYRLRHTVYVEEKGWLDSTSQHNGLEFDSLDKHAVHIIATHKQQLIGATRLLLPESCTLPAASMIDTSMNGMDSKKVAEVSRLVVRRDYRGGHREVFFGLATTGRKFLLENGYSYLAAIADRGLFFMLKRMKMPMIWIGDSVWHVGSECYPVIIDLSKAEKVVHRRDTSESTF